MLLTGAIRITIVARRWEYITLEIELSFSLKVLEDSRQVLVAANMQPDDPFPMDDKIKEGLIRF